MTESRHRPTLFRVLGFLLPAWRWVGLSTLLSTATIAAGIGLIGTSAYLISAAALQPSIAALQVAIVGVRFFGLSRGVFRYLERLVSHETNFRILAILRQWFYGRLERLAPAGLVDEQGGDLLARAIDDIDALELIYIRVVSPVLSALLVMIGMGWFVGRHDPGLAWALVCLLLTGGILFPLVIRVLSQNLAARQINQHASLSAFLVESLGGMADLLLFNHKTERRKQLAELDSAYAHTGSRLALVSGLQSGLSQLLGGLATWLVLIWLTPRVSDGALDGVLLAVLALAAAASFEAVAPLPAAGQYLDGSLAAARRLFELADREPAIAENQSHIAVLPPGIPALSVKDLSLRYSPDLPPVLSGISFELTPGKKLAIVGPNGAGKTSLVNVLLRFWDYQSGVIQLGGKDLRELSPDNARSAFSLAAQSSHLFDTTLRENLTLGRHDIDADIISRALAAAQLSDFVARLPKGLETPVGEHGLSLSGGERQRVTLARALLKPAPILILDEPFSQLDQSTARNLYAAILDAYAQLSIVTITHRFIGLENIDEVLVLQNGRILERGTHTELLRSDGLYAHYHNFQKESLTGSYQ
jgi:ATP-binding cassette subfamily C protein CydC